MADGNVYKLVEEVFRPVHYALEGLFYAGVFYGAKQVTSLILDCFSGVRTYFLPWGNYSTCDLKTKFGKWAVITGGTSGIGLAYAHEVSLIFFLEYGDDLYMDLLMLDFVAVC